MPRWNVGWKPISVSRNRTAIAGDMPFRRASIQMPQTTSASSPNVRMPNQSSEAEKPRLSESTSSDASSAQRHQQRQRVDQRGSGATSRFTSMTSARMPGTWTAGLREAAVEAAAARPQRPGDERQRRPREPRQVARWYSGSARTGVAEERDLLRQVLRRPSHASNSAGSRAVQARRPTAAHSATATSDRVSSVTAYGARRHAAPSATSSSAREREPRGPLQASAAERDRGADAEPQRRRRSAGAARARSRRARSPCRPSRRARRTARARGPRGRAIRQDQHRQPAIRATGELAARERAEQQHQREQSPAAMRAALYGSSGGESSACESAASAGSSGGRGR